MTGPLNIQAYKIKLRKVKHCRYPILLMGYARSPFRVSEKYLRIVVDLDEDDIQSHIKLYISNFVTYEKVAPGIYPIRDVSEVVCTMGNHGKTLENKYGDISLKTKPILTRFGGTFGMLKFNAKSVFITFFSFTPYWDYKPTNTTHIDSPGVYTSEKITKLNTIDAIHIKCIFIDGSVVNGSRQPILYRLGLDQPPGFKVFFQRGTIQYKRMNN